MLNSYNQQHLNKGHPLWKAIAMAFESTQTQVIGTTHISMSGRPWENMWASSNPRSYIWHFSVKYCTISTVGSGHRSQPDPNWIYLIFVTGHWFLRSRFLAVFLLKFTGKCRKIAQKGNWINQKLNLSGHSSQWLNLRSKWYSNSPYHPPSPGLSPSLRSFN
jgi:hypothetical protein